ncbi:MAG: leucyl/phenylalanyl-tRNA--protein transferase [Candidatus Sericytochromatia bacterium]|nr:leucyl/phenylalanyl-tRNA--protein transferase [Candidatus Sericytochromatia bacterium]
MITPDTILLAYAQGLFPMADEAGELGWYRPQQRALLPLDTFRVPRSLAKVMRRAPYQIRFDTAFPRVIAACADRPATWLSPEIQSVFCALHARGLAHSVEAWRDDDLVGGLYGLALGGVFFGESMFSRATDASKICLVHLVAHLRERNFALLDSQLYNPHYDRFGQVLVPHVAFLPALQAALQRPCRF